MKTIVKLIRLVYLAIAFLLSACGHRGADPQLVVDGIERGKWEVVDGHYKPIALDPNDSWLMVTTHIEGVAPKSIRTGTRVTVSLKPDGYQYLWRAADSTFEPVNGKLAVQNVLRFYWSVSDDYTGPFYVRLDGDVIGESVGNGVSVLPDR